MDLAMHRVRAVIGNFRSRELWKLVMMWRLAPILPLIAARWTIRGSPRASNSTIWFTLGTTLKFARTPQSQPRQAFRDVAPWAPAWWWVARRALANNANCKTGQSSGDRQECWAVRQFAADKLFGARRRGRWKNSRNSSRGFRDFPSWLRG